MIYERFLGEKLTEAEQKQVKAIDDDLLYYDLKVLLGETPAGEAPVLQIMLDYTVKPFAEVEEAYLALFQEYRNL